MTSEKKGIKKEENKKCVWLSVWVWRLVLTLATVGMFAFIFSNSATTGAQSSGASQSVTKQIQAVFKVIAPQSWIATASGEQFSILHEWVRKIAHFAEFFALGMFATWCYFSYSKVAVGIVLPLATVVLTPIADEFLQGQTAGRATELLDMMIDTAGGLAGVVFDQKPSKKCSLK